MSIDSSWLISLGSCKGSVSVWALPVPDERRRWREDFCLCCTQNNQESCGDSFRDLTWTSVLYLFPFFEKQTIPAARWRTQTRRAASEDHTLVLSFSTPSTVYSILSSKLRFQTLMNHFASALTDVESTDLREPMTTDLNEFDICGLEGVYLTITGWITMKSKYQTEIIQYSLLSDILPHMFKVPTRSVKGRKKEIKNISYAGPPFLALLLLVYITLKNNS